MARIVFRHKGGSCPALRWLEGDHRYRCDLVVAPQRYLAWLPAAVARRLFARWIAAGKGCDSDCQDPDPDPAAPSCPPETKCSAGEAR